MNTAPVSYQWLDFEIHNPFELAVPEDCRILPARKDVAVPGKTVATGEATGTPEVTDPAAFLFEKVKAYSDFVYDMDWTTTEGPIMDEIYNENKWRQELRQAKELIRNPTEFALLKCFYETEDGSYKGGGFVNLKLLERVLWLFNGFHSPKKPDHEDLDKTGFFPVPLTTEHKISSELFLFMALRFFYVNNCLRYSHLNDKYHQFPFNYWLVFLRVKENEVLTGSALALVEEARKVKMLWDSAPFNFCHLKTKLLDLKPQGASFLAVSWLENMGWLEDIRHKRWRTVRTEDMGPFLSGYRDPDTQCRTRALLLGTFRDVGNPSVRRRLFVCEGVDMESTSDVTCPSLLLPLAHTVSPVKEDYWVLLDEQLNFLEIKDSEIEAKRQQIEEKNKSIEAQLKQLELEREELEAAKQAFAKEQIRLRIALRANSGGSYYRGYAQGQASMEEAGRMAYILASSRRH